MSAIIKWSNITVLWLSKGLNESSNPQKTPHSLPERVRYRVSVVVILEETDGDITELHYIWYLVDINDKTDYWKHCKHLSDHYKHINNNKIGLTKQVALKHIVCKYDSSQAEEDWEFTQEIHYCLHFHV